MKNSKSKASQPLINSNRSSLVWISADIWNTRTNENTASDNNKFTNRSKKTGNVYRI